MRRLPALVVGTALLVALALTADSIRVRLPRSFDAGPHAWASAHHSLIARSFARQGVIASNGLPIQNNPPVGDVPDVYLHWPPLFAMLIAQAFRAFGESEATAHAVAAMFAATLLIAFTWLARGLLPPRSVWVASLALLTTPVFFCYQDLVEGITLGLSFALLEVLCFVRATQNDAIDWRWGAGSVAAAFLAATTRWEPICVVPGLLAASLWSRSRPRILLSGAVIASSVGALGSIAALYWVAAPPGLTADLWETALFRAGVGSLSHDPPIHQLAHEAFLRMSGSLEPYLRFFLRRSLLDRIGLLPLLATIATAAALLTGSIRDAARRTIFVALLALPTLWYVAMPVQAFVHDYELLLLAPLSAASTGALYAWLDTALAKARGSARSVSQAALALTFCIALLLPLVRFHAGGSHNEGVIGAGMNGPWSRHLPPDWRLRFSRQIRATTGENAIVMIPFHSMVPVYYSERHLIRGIVNDELVERARREVRSSYRDAPIYLAVLPQFAAAFPQTKRRYPLATRRENFELLDLTTRREGDVD